MIRVILYEDEMQTRAIIKAILEDEEGIELVESYSTVSSVADQVKRFRPEVILLDIGLPGKSGLDVVRLIKELNPATHILMLTNEDDNKIVREAFEKGASGYMLKSDLDNLGGAIRDVHRKHAHISASVANHLITIVKDNAAEQKTKSSTHLTPKETEVLTLLAQGKKREEIAEMLHIQIHTVGDHIKSIYAKLQINSKSQATLMAVKMGLI